MSYSTLRIGGLASGLDVDQIVADLMRAERIPLDRLQQQRQLWAWKQEDYRTMNTALAGLRDQVFTMKLQSTYQAHQATISDSTVASVTAGATAADGSYSLEVLKLAKGVQVMSGTALPEEANTDGTTKSLAAQFGLAPDQNVSFTIEGAQKSGGVYTTATISLNTSTDNVYTLVSKINSALDADGITPLGLQASYDATYNRLVVVSKTTGATQHFKVASDAVVNLAGGGTANLWADKLGIAAGPYDGQDAQFKIAGSTDALTASTNTVSILGLNITLKKETAPGSPVTINVTRDVDAVYNSIKAFVDKYNETLDKVNAELQEERYRDYLPLTEEQKKEMKDSDIVLWTEKARSGMLRNDPLLTDILGKMRLVVGGTVEGLSGADSLFAIGITTGSYWEGGKLVINETKLRKAISDDPDGVLDLFTKSSDVQAKQGLAVRLYDEINNGIKRLSDYAGSTSGFSLVDQSYMGKELQRYDERIAEMEERLTKIEDRYWRQFTALEQVVNQMNAQSAWLAQQFGRSGQG